MESIDHTQSFEAASNDLMAMSMADFCSDWTRRYRTLAVAAQAVLKVLFPQGAAIVGALINIADTYCENSD